MPAAQHDTNDPKEAAPERSTKADKLITYHTAAAIAVGFVPVPLLDFAALTGVQLNLIRSLAKLYDVEFSADLGKSLLTALVGGSVSVGSTVLLKAIPGIGSLLGSVGFSAGGGASTYAVGKVFLQHFESGGTFLTFDPEKVRDYYARQFAERVQKPTSPEDQKDYTGIKP